MTTGNEGNSTKTVKSPTDGAGPRDAKTIPYVTGTVDAKIAKPTTVPAPEKVPYR